MMSNLSVIKSDFFFILVTSLLSLFGLIFYFFNYQYVLAIILVIINIFFLIKFLNKVPIFILFFYILLHSKIFVLFYFWNFSISFWPSFQNIDEMGPVMISLLLFILILGNVISSKKISENFYSFKITKPNFLVFCVLSIILILILLFGIKGDNLFLSGGYNNFGNFQKSTLHEYFILIFLFFIIFAPKAKVYKFIIQLFLLLYTFKTLLYGGRIEVVQIFLLFFYLFYLFKYRIKTIYVLCFLFFGIYFSIVFSKIRSNPGIILTKNYLTVFNPKEVFKIDVNNPVLSSTEGDVVQSSARIVGLINTNELTISNRFVSFVSFLVSPIIPSSYLSDLSNLSTYKQNVVQSGGGALISTFFYSWLGYIGPIIAGLFIGIFINMFFNLYSNSTYIYGICLLIMFPRWFSYNPIFLVKFSLYSVSLFYIIKFFSVNNKLKSV